MRHPEQRSNPGHLSDRLVMFYLQRCCLSVTPEAKRRLTFWQSVLYTLMLSLAEKLFTCNTDRHASSSRELCITITGERFTGPIDLENWLRGGSRPGRTRWFSLVTHCLRIGKTGAGLSRHVEPNGLSGLDAGVLLLQACTVPNSRDEKKYLYWKSGNLFFHILNESMEK